MYDVVDVASLEAVSSHIAPTKVPPSGHEYDECETDVSVIREGDVATADTGSAAANALTLISAMLLTINPMTLHAE
ncbi:MAG: hypothetical protein WCF25_06770 [Acidimicrobiales bacterium]